MTSQCKWSSAKPRTELSNKPYRVEMLTKLNIFHEKFGTDIPPPESDTETVKNYYHRALEVIEDRSNKNYNTLQISLQEFVEDIVDDDDEDPGMEKKSRCSRFWDCMCNICSCLCLSRTEE